MVPRARFDRALFQPSLMCMSLIVFSTTAETDMLALRLTACLASESAQVQRSRYRLSAVLPRFA